MFDSLTYGESQELKAFFQRQNNIEQLAVKVSHNEPLTELERIDIKNSIDNMNNILSIRKLNTKVRKDIERLVDTLKNYELVSTVKVDKSVEKPESLWVEPPKVKAYNYSGDSAIHIYLREKGYSLVTAFIMTPFMLYADEIVNFILTKLDIVSGTNGTEAMANAMNSMTSIITLTMSLVGVMLITTTFLGLAIDMLYITMPWFRAMVEEKNEAPKLVSQAAQIAVMQSGF